MTTHPTPTDAVTTAAQRAADAIERIEAKRKATSERYAAKLREAGVQPHVWEKTS